MSDKDGVQWQCYVQSGIKKCTYPEPFKAGESLQMQRLFSFIMPFFSGTACNALRQVLLPNAHVDTEIYQDPGRQRAKLSQQSRPALQISSPGQVPYVEVALISSLCSLLDARLPSHNLEAGKSQVER